MFDDGFGGEGYGRSERGGGGSTGAATEALAGDAALAMSVVPLVCALGVELLEGGEVVLGVVFVRVDCRDGSVGGEALCADSDSFTLRSRAY